jgi:hypothetical protein
MSTGYFKDTYIENNFNIDLINETLKYEIQKNYKLIHKSTVTNIFKDNIWNVINTKIGEEYKTIINLQKGRKPRIRKTVIDTGPVKNYIDSFRNTSIQNIQSVNNIITE